MARAPWTVRGSAWRLLHTLVDTAGRDFRKLPHAHECTDANLLEIANCRQRCANVTISGFTTDSCDFVACEVDCYSFVRTTYAGDCNDQRTRYTDNVCAESFLNATGCDRCEYCDDCSVSDLAIGFIIFGCAAALVIVPFVVWLVRRKMRARGANPVQLYAAA